MPVAPPRKAESICGTHSANGKAAPRFAAPAGLPFAAPAGRWASASPKCRGCAPRTPLRGLRVPVLGAAARAVCGGGRTAAGGWVWRGACGGLGAGRIAVRGTGGVSAPGEAECVRELGRRGAPLAPACSAHASHAPRSPVAARVRWGRRGRRTEARAGGVDGIRERAGNGKGSARGGARGKTRPRPWVECTGATSCERQYGASCVQPRCSRTRPGT